MTDDDYRPQAYWSDRLRRVGGLRSTGHQQYSESYNRWIYRRKGVVLRGALRGADLTRVVDLGSGVGWVIEQLDALGAREVVGIDIADDAVVALQQRFPRHTFHQVVLGAEPIPVEDGWATTATFLDVTYHIVDETAWESAVADAARVLAPGGRLVVIDAFGAEERRPASHVRFRSLARWELHASAVGLVLDARHPCYRWLSRGRDESQLRRLPQRARGAIEYGLDAVLPRPAHLTAAVFRRR